MQHSPCDEIQIRNNFKDFFMYLVFLILPQKYAKSYIVLTFLAFVYRHKHKKFKCDNINKDKLNYLLQVSLNDKILLLPSFTYHWIWKNELLSQKIHDSQAKCSLEIQQVLSNDKAVLHHISSMADKLVNSIPRLIKFKLNLHREVDKTVFKNDLIRTLVYNF